MIKFAPCHSRTDGDGFRRAAGEACGDCRGRRIAADANVDHVADDSNISGRVNRRRAAARILRNCRRRVLGAVCNRQRGGSLEVEFRLEQRAHLHQEQIGGRRSVRQQRPLQVPDQRRRADGGRSHGRI